MQVEPLLLSPSLRKTRVILKIQVVTRERDLREGMPMSGRGLVMGPCDCPGVSGLMFAVSSFRR